MSKWNMDTRRTTFSPQAYADYCGQRTSLSGTWRSVFWRKASLSIMGGTWINPSNITSHKRMSDTPPAPSPGAMDPSKEEVRRKCQEDCTDDQEAPGQTQAQKGTLQRVEARTGSLEQYREIAHTSRDRVRKAKAQMK